MNLEGIKEVLKEVCKGYDYRVLGEVPNDAILSSERSEIINSDSKALMKEEEMELCTCNTEKHMCYLEN